MGEAAQAYITGQEAKWIQERSPFGVVKADNDMRWAKVIVTAIRNAPEQLGTLHRGLRFAKDNMPKWAIDAKKGSVLTLNAPAGFSEHAGIAKSFHGGDVYYSEQSKKLDPLPEKLRLVIQDRYKGLHVGAGGVGDENEVITYGRFRVDENTVDKRGVRVIVLRQLEVH